MVWLWKVYQLSENYQCNSYLPWQISHPAQPCDWVPGINKQLHFTELAVLTLIPMQMKKNVFPKVHFTGVWASVCHRQGTQAITPCSPALPDLAWELQQLHQWDPETREWQNSSRWAQKSYPWCLISGSAKGRGMGDALPIWQQQLSAGPACRREEGVDITH